jgi:hypothetical protein
MLSRLLLMEKPFPPDGSLSSRLMANMRRDFASALLQETFAGVGSLPEDL